MLSHCGTKETDQPCPLHPHAVSPVGLMSEFSQAEAVVVFMMLVRKEKRSPSLPFPCCAAA